MSKNILELIFVAIYFLLVSMIIKALVLNFFPKFFKYFKRGMSKYENVRITTFRALLRFHLDSYVVETLTAAYSIIVLFFIHESILSVQLLFSTAIYVSIFLMFSIMIAVYEYFMIQKSIE